MEPMPPHRQAPLWGTLLLLIAALPAAACDLCALYSSQEARQPAQGLYGGAFSRYSNLATLRHEGTEMENDEDQYVHSLSTQLLIGYRFSGRFSLQANLPVLRRTYQRPGHEGREKGALSGLGDAAVLARWRLGERVRGEDLMVWTLSAGVKLPTGKTERLAGEAGHEEEVVAPLPKAAAPLRTAHGDEGLGVHDHDLALGSGSFDGILGLAGFWGRHRLFATLDLQYALRREGDHHYRFANDLTWSLNPGYYSLLDHHRSLGLGLGLSGEIKGEDEVHGASAEDTALTAVYLGPTLSFSRGDHLAADAALELPLVQDNAAFQVVPSYRLKLGVTGRF